MRLAVGLLLGPAGAGDEEQFRIRADRLLVGGRSLDAGDGGALMRGGQGNGHEFDAGLAGGTGKRGAATGLEGDDPRALRAAEHGLHALAVVPTRDGGLAVCGGDAGGVRVDATAEALRGAGEHAVHARGGGREDDRGGGGLAERLDREHVAGVARLRKVGAGDAEQARGPGGGDLVGGGLHLGADEADDERRAGERGGERLGRAERFESGFAERTVGFGVGENENGFHGESSVGAG